jgi:hypothetical protein
MKRAWVLVVVGVVGSGLGACGGSPAPAPASPAAPAASSTMPGETSCDQAVGRMMDTLTAGKNDVPPDQVKKFHDLFVQHCQADGWSAQVRQCFGSIKTLDEGDKCGSELTDAQRESLDKATQPDNAAGGAPPPPTAQPASSTSPAPSPPATSGTRGATQKPGKSGDPCDGGN